MRNDTVLSVLGIRNQDVIRMIRGQRGCGTGTTSGLDEWDGGRLRRGLQRVRLTHDMLEARASDECGQERLSTFPDVGVPVIQAANNRTSPASEVEARCRFVLLEVIGDPSE